MERDQDHQSAFKPSLGLFDATAISVGAIIGGGIFVVTGIAAGLAGSALLISMLVATTISLFTASSFAELTSWSPKEGSIYEYAYQLISPFAGFLAGWMWILSNTFAGAAVSLGFAYYLTALWPTLPSNYIAVVMCLSFTAINCYGVRESARLNSVLVAAKLLILALFITLGLFHINQSNFVPFKPFEAGVLYGAFYIFFAYGGLARVAVISEEVKDAKRNVPRAILLSLVISTIVYVLVGAVAVGLVGASHLANSDSPLAEAISTTGSNAAVSIISVGGMIATASVLLTSILGVSRVIYAMAKRKDLPEAVSKLDPKRNTPYYSVLITGLAMTILVLLIDLTGVVAVSAFSLLFYYTLANVSVLRLRKDKKVRSKLMATFGAATCLAFLAFALFASPQSWVIGTACLLAGVVYYVVKQKLRPT